MLLIGVVIEAILPPKSLTTLPLLPASKVCDPLVLKYNSTDGWVNKTDMEALVLFATDMLDESTGYAVGKNGTVVKTNDAGYHWINQNAATTKNLNAVDFIDENTGVAVGNNGIIIKTINGGATYSQQCALSNVTEPTTMKFYVSQDDCGTSSLYPNNEQHLGKIKEVINVPVYSLKMFFDGFPWERFNYIDYIKIDAQGSDLNILKSAENYLQERVVFVTAEGDGHQYIGANECNDENIIEYMKSQNFIHINHANTHDPTFINKNYIDKLNSIYIAQKL